MRFFILFMYFALHVFNVRSVAWGFSMVGAAGDFLGAGCGRYRIKSLAGLGHCLFATRQHQNCFQNHTCPTNLLSYVLNLWGLLMLLHFGHSHHFKTFQDSRPMRLCELVVMYAWLLPPQFLISATWLQIICDDSCKSVTTDGPRYPMLCIGLAELTDVSAASICLTSLSLFFASVSYALLRFDQMQRATLELALVSEAICLQAPRLEKIWLSWSQWPILYNDWSLLAVTLENGLA